MTTYRIDHVHLRSLDPEAASHFYVEMFGATLTDRQDVKGVLRVTLDLAGLALFIDRVDESVSRTPEPPFRGIEHIGLTVPDIDRAAADLKSRGVRFVVEPHEIKPGLKIAFLTGPDDVRIELLQRS